MPVAGTILGWQVIADVDCTCVIDIWKANAARPTNANTITASAKPGLSAAGVAASTTLTGWTTTVSAGDYIAFELESVSGGSPKTININITIG